MKPSSLATALAAALGHPVAVSGLRAVGGGGVCQAAVAETSFGPVFVKWAPGAAAEVFASEAAGLRALAAADSGLRIPRVVAVLELPAALVLEYLPPGRPTPDHDARLGEGLARLHACTAAAFGFERVTHCGGTPQPNDWTQRWPDFYRERRLAPLLRMIEVQGALGADDRRLFERLGGRLDALLAGTEEAPALIHGDLWSGNAIVDANGRPGLVDPAVSYSHREAEMGMMVLFGGFSTRVFEAYESVRPLAPGWRERLPLYSLYHVLNHALLFGSGYLGQARAIARGFAGT